MNYRTTQLQGVCGEVLYATLGYIAMFQAQLVERDREGYREKLGSVILLSNIWV